MFDSFFKNLHYFKLINNELIFNNRNYYIEDIDQEDYNKTIIELYENEETQIQTIKLIYEVYQDLLITWQKAQGFDGAKKYIDRTAYIEYFDERLNELRRVTIKNYRMFSEEEDQEFIERLPSNLYELIYA